MGLQDISSHMGGNWLKHTDLPAITQTWTIRQVTEEQLGNDTKVVLYFHEHQKGLGLNKINLTAVAQLYGTNATTWAGQRLELFKDMTFFQGRQMPCVRVRAPQGPPPQQPPVAAQAPQQYVPPQPAQQWQQPQQYQQPQQHAPVAAPQPQQQAAPPQAGAPWEGQQEPADGF